MTLGRMMRKCVTPVHTCSMSFLPLLLAALLVPSIQQQQQQSSSTNRQGKKIASIPLTPHHQAAASRRLLDEDDLSSSLSTIDRSHYGRRRQLASSDQSLQVAALYQGYGTHYADLWCGSPPQRQTVIVDTGSGVTAFPCSGCSDCGVPKYHIDKLFVEDDSSTFKKLTCDECLRGHCKGTSSTGECSIGMSYQEGSSWTAYEGQDLCYVGGMHETAVSKQQAIGHSDDLDPFIATNYAFNLKFGCQTRLTGLFRTQLADGIMGMDNADAAFWAQMSKSLGVAEEFSLCFGRSPTASREGTNAGAMTLGGTDERLHKSQMVYSSTTPSSGFYNVHVRKVYLKKNGGETAAVDDISNFVKVDISESDLNRGSVIVDSGTTDSYYNRALEAPFQKTWRQIVGEAFNNDDMTLTEEELHAFPTIIFQLSGDVAKNQEVAAATNGPVTGLVGEKLDPDNPYDVLLAIPASHYFEYDDRKDTYTARFYVDEGGGSVLGANSMMGHDVYFDVQNHRVGWAESDCDYPTLVKPFVDSGHLVPSRQDPADENDETTPEEGPQKADSVCQSAKCRFYSLVGLVLAGAAVVAIIMNRRRRSRNISYQIAGAELELQNTGSADDEEGGFSNVRYRDRPTTSQHGSETPSGASTGSFSSANAYLEDAEEDDEPNPFS